MKRPTPLAGDRGFSLVEVMVALIIICVGLLGIAKLEALMLSSTGTSRLRALVALQAASLADAMHANRDYWDGGSTYWVAANGALILAGAETTTGSTTSTAWTGTNAPGPSPTTCLDSVCNSEQLAQYDLNLWGNDLAQVLKTSNTSIKCSTGVTTGLVSCLISISWTENTVAANSQESTVGAPAAFQQQTYTLVVEP
jgi:type IV pilus assembly protein PilV